MERFKNFWSKWAPLVWANCWVIIITAGSIAGVIVSVKWLLRVMGVL